jgi:hypothetical protein
VALPLDRLRQLSHGDQHLARFGRDLACAILVGDGDDEWLIEIDKGEVTRVTKGPLIMPRSHITLRASSDAWARHIEAVPPLGYHDLFAMRRFRHLKIEGDTKLLASYLFYVKRLFALLRPQEARA